MIVETLDDDWPSVEHWNELRAHPESSLTVTEGYSFDWRSNLVCGDAVPGWANEIQSVNILGVRILAVKNVYYAPSFGTLITSNGNIIKTTFGEARFITPTYRQLPSFEEDENGITFRPPVDVEQYDEKGIFLPWGGVHNYGHFLLDSLTAYWHLCQSSNTTLGLLSPPLKSWQIEHIKLTNEFADVQLTSSELVFIKQAYYVNVMDHFLHRVGPTIRLLRDTQLAQLGEGPSETGRRIYIARPEDNDKRTLLNEEELRHSLKLARFEIVSPETMFVTAQIALFASASIIIAPTGAALANLIYCRPHTRVIEIISDLDRQIWVRNICIQGDLKWLPYFASSSPSENLVSIDGIAHPQIGIKFGVNVETLLDFACR